MKLVPVTGVLEAVTKAHEASPEGAQMLVQLALFETLSDLAETHRGEIEPVMLANMEKRLTGARQRLLRNTVGKALDGQDDVDLESAEYLAVLDTWVGKSLSGALRELFNREHPRDASGRFMSSTVSSGSPENPPESRTSSSRHNAVSQAQKWRDDGLIKDDTKFRVFAHVRDQNNRLGQTKRFIDTDLASMAADLNQLGDDAQITSISVDRRHLTKPAGGRGGQAAVDLVRTFAGADEATSRRLAQSLPLDDQGNVKDQTLNAQRWHGASNGTDRKGYRQLAMTGEALRRVSLPGTTQHTVGAMAQLSGELGPEAEKILGPGIRRTAYRFRGTERRPDREVVTQVRSAERMASGKTVPEADRSGQDYSVAMATAWGKVSNPDERHLKVVGDTAVGYLLGLGGGDTHLPSRELTELSLESGEVPPSEGILIDANGHVHSQSVGYNGDHYLPFDLKNLNGLFGGQYVRTRAAGGPSTEDLYTGLMSGARQVQVVSNSGVFTFEFDPDLRGGRRYSDKAKRMVQRYGELLDAIASGKLYQTDLSPEKKAVLRRQAAEMGGGEDDYKANLNRLESQARMQGALSDDDDDAIEEGAENWARTKIQPERNQLQKPDIGPRMEELKREFREKYGPEVRRLRLDGPGYDRAMRALKQEFPYYLRNAEYQSLPDWLSTRNVRTSQKLTRHYAPDRGRVQTGQTNAYLPGHTEASASLARRRSNPNARMYSHGSTASEPTGASEAAAATSSTAAAQPAAPATSASKEPSAADMLASMKKAGSPYQVSVHNAMRGGLNLLFDVTPVGGPIQDGGTDTWLEAQEADDFVHVMGRRFKHSHPDNPRAAFVNWLVNADASTQARVLESRQRVLQKLEDSDVGVYTPEGINASYDQLEKLIKLAHPFAAPSEEEGHVEYLEAPNLDNPRPIPLKDFPVGEKPEWYDQAAKKLTAFEPATAEALASIESEDDTRVATRISAKIAMLENTDDEARRKKYEQEAVALQRAWTFKTARGATSALRAMAGAGGADPKAPGQDVGKSLRPRRVLMFHTPPGASVAKSRRHPASR